jgi:hypothetical protein
MDFDKEMSLDEEMREDLAGTTAVCVVIKNDELYCVRTCVETPLGLSMIL